MEKKDLRVTKTTRAIKSTFLKQICSKPVNKLTVTGLAKEAEINKGTFYLHYSDIFALYDEVLEDVINNAVSKYNPYPDFLRDPEAFVRAFLFTEFDQPSKEAAALLSEENLRFATRYPSVFVDAFKRKIYDGSGLAANKENDAKLEYMLAGMLALLIKSELIADNNPFTIKFLAGSIRQLFS